MAGSPPAAFADAIVVAAGSSARMGGIDKLQAMLDGRSVLQWSVAAMAAAASVRRVIIVAAPSGVESLASEPWVRSMGATVVGGGERRQDSVAAGVEASDAEVVLIHDGARPFVLPDVVDAVARIARADGAAIPLLPIVDALKKVSDGTASSVDGGTFQRAQTPQGARRQLLADAFRSPSLSAREYRDEAALLEAAGVRVRSVPGDPSNIKITEPGDLEVARAIAQQRVAVHRYASATDTHPFGPDDGLALGGITIAEAPRLFGHSDGDVVLHAIADAMLAAAAAPDLGRQFPASDSSTSGIASRELVGIVRQRLAADGWRAATADVSILGARPWLGARRLEEMRVTVAGLLDLPLERVSLKASTGNLSGPEGGGRVITATALVGLARD